jgi:hypothetical protein
MQEAGFTNVELAAETGFNSSPVTKGVLLRASRSGHAPVEGKERPMEESLLSIAKPVAEEKLPENKMVEHLSKRALELGAKKAKIIDTHTIVVEEWVRWKCQYGCPMYAKDAFHAPLAPDIESTKKVMGEYSKALFINGSNGKQLSDIAVKLEGEAYCMGYYKAFAFAAFATAPGGT